MHSLERDCAHLSVRCASSLSRLGAYHELKLSSGSLSDFLNRSRQLGNLASICSYVISSAVETRDTPFLLKFLSACHSQSIPISVDDYSVIWDLAHPSFESCTRPDLLHCVVHILNHHLTTEVLSHQAASHQRFAALELATLLARYQLKLAHRVLCGFSAINSFFSHPSHQLLRTLLLFQFATYLGDSIRARELRRKLQEQRENLPAGEALNARALALTGEILTRTYLDLQDVEGATHLANSLECPRAYFRSQLCLAHYWAQKGEVECVESVFQSVFQRGTHSHCSQDSVELLYCESLILAHLRNPNPDRAKIARYLEVLQKAGSVSVRVCNALLKHKYLEPAAGKEAFLNSYSCAPSADTFDALVQLSAECSADETTEISASAFSWNFSSPQLYHALFRRVFSQIPPTAKNKLYLSGLIGQYENIDCLWDVNSVNLVMDTLLRFDMLDEAIVLFRHKADKLFLDTSSVNLLFQAVLLQRGRPNINYMVRVFNSVVERAVRMRYSANSCSNQSNLQMIDVGTSAMNADTDTTVTDILGEINQSVSPCTNDPSSSLVPEGISMLSPSYNPRMAPDSKTFEYRALGGNVDERLLLLMSQLGLTPSSPTFNVLLISAIRHADTTLALQILAEWIACHPDEVSDAVVQSVVTSFVNLGAQSLFEPLKNLVSNLRLSPATHVLLQSMR